jgi:PAS domain S-box-containing protein
MSLGPHHSRIPLPVQRASREARDATERNHAEEALRRSEKQLRDVIETIPAMAWTTDPNGSRDFANHRWQEYTGMTVEEMSGDGWKKPLHPADLPRHIARCHYSLASGKPFENEIRVRRAADGQYRWFLHRAVALRDEAGEIVKWYGTATDIEDLKQAEAKLRQDEQELRRITDAIPLSIVVLNPDGRAIYANRVALDYTGLTLDDVVDNNFRQRVFHPEDVEKLRKSRQEALTPRFRLKTNNALSGKTASIAGSWSAIALSWRKTGRWFAGTPARPTLMTASALKIGRETRTLLCATNWTRHSCSRRSSESRRPCNPFWRR